MSLVDKESMRRQQRGFAKELAEVKSNLISLKDQVQDHLNKMAKVVDSHEKTISNQETILNGLIEMMGDQEGLVDTILKQKRGAKEKHDSELKVNVQTGLDFGYLTVAEAVTADSLTVVYITNKDGEPLDFTGMHWTEFSQFNPDLQPNMLGKVVGDVVRSDEDSLEIKEIYNINRAKFEEFLAAKKEAAKPAETPTETTATPAEVSNG